MIKTKNVKISSLSGGYFKFSDDMNEISLHLSSLSGRETVTVNDFVVSENQNFRKKTVHEFSIGPASYVIDLEYKSMIRGHIECSLFKNEMLFKRYKLNYVNRNGETSSWKTTLIFVLVGLVFGLILGMKLIPVWIVFFIGIAILILAIRTKLGSWQCVEEVDEQAADAV